MSVYNFLRVSTCIGLVLGLTSTRALASSFEDCPTEAFLVQDSVAKIYGVNLATGYYEMLSSEMGTSNKLNALGFSFHDNYLYGYSYEFGTMVRIGSDYIAQPLSLNGAPSVSFYVGDVALNENSYYMYRNGRDYGLYKVDLDESSTQYLNVERVIDGEALSLAIYDMAFHPTNGLIYSVDRQGNLVSVSSDDGELSQLGNVGESGTFGAVYFDVDGNLYISRNTDGYIFRIDVSDVEPYAEFFAYGPSSGNNDGARCALAPIVSEDSNVDFGDAPDSYGTSIDSNGARHEMSEDLFLGETSGGNDGINFVTGFETGMDTLVNVTAKGEGNLNFWVDWDQNGTFDGDEQVVVDKALNEGANRVLLSVPFDAVTGETWSRARYSSASGIGATGGVSDGEVEDQKLTITFSGVSVVSYPGSNAYVTLAFEDNWPELGDYDMNDAVFAYRTKQYVDENQQVLRYDIEGRILAVGAGYHSGFAVQLDDVRTDNIAVDLMKFEINGEEQVGSALESNSAGDDAVILLFDDLWSQVQASGDCSYYRTQTGCNSFQETDFFVSVPLVSSMDSQSAPSSTLNPFIFATPGMYHGDAFVSPPGRSLEIHLKNKRVSSQFNLNLFSTYDDFSDYLNGTSFLSRNNMPWAIEVPMLWAHPKERIDITKAYPDFRSFVESSGDDNPSWYTRAKAVDKKVMDNE